MSRFDQAYKRFKERKKLEKAAAMQKALTSAPPPSPYVPRQQATHLMDRLVKLRESGQQVPFDSRDVQQANAGWLTRERYTHLDGLAKALGG
ncbi:MAG TPA: hypothetical protein VFB38_05425 [Chthonomonadaceae bacterium]|nr:hypothetical protein [Chthonomonadaceae bacterium]